MKGTTSRRLKAGALAVGVAGTLGFVVAGSAPADTERGTDAQITMEFTPNTGPPTFEGAKTVSPGQSLEIVNNSDPQEIGPHTFTIVERKDIPATRKEAKDCFKGKSKVCKRIFKAHKVDFQNETVGKPIVEKGKLGWDKSFTEKKDGDSWFTEEQNDTTVRTVPGKDGSKFFYFCVVHPEMSGKLKVEDPN